jgi:hypothetical protein
VSDEFAAEFARMLAQEDQEPEPAPTEAAPEPAPVDPEPIERAVLRDIAAKQARHQGIVDLLHPREEA